MSKNLTIIIVTFNSAKIIGSCLEKIDFSKYECTVVDNASLDDTSTVVARDFPQVKIIKLDKNIGYGRANNVALRQVETEFSLILNPDAFLSAADIEKLLSLCNSDNKIAIAAPLLLPYYPAKDEDIAKQLAVAKSNLIADCGEYVSVKYVIGAILCLRMSIFREIGFF